MAAAGMEEREEQDPEVGREIDEGVFQQEAAFSLLQGSTSVQDDTLHPLPKIPGYMKNTFSLSVPDTNESAEVTRIRNTFRTGSFCSLAQLPNVIKPNSVRDHIKTRALKNQLGTMYVQGPDGVGVHAFKVSSTQGAFQPLTYVPTDYNKGSDMRKAQFEEERNQNASYSKKPFKTSENADIPLYTPHNFGVDKTKKSKSEKDANQDDFDPDLYFDAGAMDALNDDGMDFELQRRQIHRRLDQLNLGLVVRDEYSWASKSKFLAGDFRTGVSGNING